MDEDVETPTTILRVDLGDCIIESYNPDVEDGRSEARRVADSLVSKKVRDVVLSQTGIDIGERAIRTRVVRMPNEFVVIPHEPTFEIFQKKEETPAWKL